MSGLLGNTLCSCVSTFFSPFLVRRYSCTLWRYLGGGGGPRFSISPVVPLSRFRPFQYLTRPLCATPFLPPSSFPPPPHPRSPPPFFPHRFLGMATFLPVKTHAERYICFYAYMFGLETRLTIKMDDVIKLSKEYTYKALPDAIAVTTRNGKTVRDWLASQCARLRMIGCAHMRVGCAPKHTILRISTLRNVHPHASASC